MHDTYHSVKFYENLLKSVAVVCSANSNTQTEVPRADNTAMEKL